MKHQTRLNMLVSFFVGRLQVPYMKTNRVRGLRRRRMTQTPTTATATTTTVHLQHSQMTWMANMAPKNLTWAILICRAFDSPKKIWRHYQTLLRPYPNTARINCSPSCHRIKLENYREHSPCRTTLRQFR